MTLCLNIPQTITAGDTVTWKTAADGIYNSTDYDLSWSIRGTTGLDVSSTADGQGWTTTISAAASGLLLTGNYQVQAYATNEAGQRTTVGFTQVKVIANLAAQSTSSAYDGRSEAEKMLDAVSAAIQTLLEGGAVQSYSIQGRNLSRYSLEELIKLRDQLRAEVRRERQKQCGEVSDRLFIRFGGNY